MESRNRLMLGVAIAVVPPLMAAGAAVAGQVGAPLWVLVGLKALGGVVLAGTGAYRLWDERQAAKAAHRSGVAALLRTGLPVPTVADVDPHGELSVFRSSLAVRVDQNRPPYVARDNDEELHRLLTAPESGMVLVRGLAKSGKKRTAFEVLRACCGDRPILVPVRLGSAELPPLRQLLELGLPVGAETLIVQSLPPTSISAERRSCSLRARGRVLSNLAGVFRVKMRAAGCPVDLGGVA